MKNNKINRWAARCGIMIGMAALPLSDIHAAARGVNGGTVVESGATYEAVSATSALQVYGGADYSGTNITLSATFSSGNGRFGAYVYNQGHLALTDSTITTTGTSATDAYAVVITGTSSAILNNVNINANGSNSSPGLRVSVGSQVLFTGGSISTTGSSSQAFQAAGGSIAIVNNAYLKTSGTYNSNGLSAYGENTIISGSNIIIETYGFNSHAINPQNGAIIDLSAANIKTYNDNSYGLLLYNDGTATLTDSSITTTGYSSHGVAYIGKHGASLTLNNVNINVIGEKASGVGMLNTTGTDAGQQTLVINGGTIISENNSALGININHERADGALPNASDLTGIGTVFDVTITSGAKLTGTAAIRIGSIISGTDAAGNIVQVDKETKAIIRVDNSDLTGDVNIGHTATATIDLENDTILTGNLTGSGSSTTTVNLDNSVLTGKSSLNDNAILNLALANGATWNLTGKSKLTTLTVNNGSITIAKVQGDDLTVTNGISGQTKLYIGGLDGSVSGQKEIRVVVDESDNMDNNVFTLGNSVSGGMYNYALDNRNSGAWLVGNGIGEGGDAVLNTAGAVSGFWFTQMDNLNKRMGELRYNAPSKGNLIENIWLRSYGQQANINTGISGVKGFSETQYGVDLGTDKAWLIDDNNTLYTGVFAGYGGADRDFHSGYNGSTDSGYGGLYGTWTHKDGWYADAVAKGQYFRNSFDGEDHGAYDSVGVGLSLELGRQFQFADGWFAEPSVQVSYVHLMNDNYVTTQGMSVDLNDSDVIQFYGGARFGRNIKLTQSGWLQPYIKVGAIEQISSGGQVKASGGEWRPNTDGARGIVGAGVVWQLDDANQLHLDYEAAFGDKYDKPWGLNFGYRHQF